MLDQTDNDLILYMAGCTLARKPGKNNWVEEDAVNGLPEYICRIARAINRDDPSKSISQVIAIAVNRVKVWARGGGGVTAKTRAKAAAAVAQWEKKKAAAKLDNKKVKATHIDELFLNFSSYNVDDVRRQYRENSGMNDLGNSRGPYRWVREMWSDYLIVSIEENGQPEKLVRVPYTVDGQGKATFGDEVEVKQVFVEASHVDLTCKLTDAQLEKASLIPCTDKDNRSLVENIAIGKKLQKERLELLAFSADKPHLLRLVQEG